MEHFGKMAFLTYLGFVANFCADMLILTLPEMQDEFEFSDTSYGTYVALGAISHGLFIILVSYYIRKYSPFQIAAATALLSSAGDLILVFLPKSLSGYLIAIAILFKTSIYTQFIYRSVMLDNYAPFDFRARIIATSYIASCFGGGLGFIIASAVDWRIAHLISFFVEISICIWALALEPDILHSEKNLNLNPRQFYQLFMTKFTAPRTILFIIMLPYTSSIVDTTILYIIKYTEDVFDMDENSAAFYSVIPYFFGLLSGQIIFSITVDRIKKQYESERDSIATRRAMFELVLLIVCICFSVVAVCYIWFYFAQTLEEFVIINCIAMACSYGAPTVVTQIWSVAQDLSDAMVAILGIVHALEIAVLSVSWGIMLDSGIGYRDTAICINLTSLVSVASLYWLRFSAGDMCLGYEGHEKLTEMSVSETPT